MSKTNENGEIALSKGDNDMFTEAWTVVDAIQNLSDEDRAVLDQFGEKWFDGFSLYTHSPMFEAALAVFRKHTELKRKVRASKYGTPEHERDWTTPEHNPDFRDSSPWPKYRTKEMKDSGLNYRAYRAWYRAKVRDEVRAGFNIEQQALVKLRDENTALKAKLAELDELKETIEAMQSVMQDIVDEVEQVKPRPTLKLPYRIPYEKLVAWGLAAPGEQG
jgi:hypothetical protein